MPGPSRGGRGGPESLSHGSRDWSALPVAPPGAAGGAGIDATQQRLGTQLQWPDAEPGFGNPDRGAVLSVVRGDLLRFAPERLYEAGCWVPAVRVLGSNNVAAKATILPVVARVDFGAGGITQSLEASAAPGFVLQVPATFCEVILSLENWITPEPAAAAFGAALAPIPDAFKVQGTLSRGFSSARAYRAFFLRPALIATLPIWSGTIPPYARTVALDAAAPAAFGVSPLYTATVFLELFPLAPTAATRIFWTGADLLANQQTGREVVVPVGVTHWRLRASVALATATGIVQSLRFGVEL